MNDRFLGGLICDLTVRYWATAERRLWGAALPIANVAIWWLATDPIPIKTNQQSDRQHYREKHVSHRDARGIRQCAI